VIHWSVTDGVGLAVLDRQERRNALDMATVVELTDCLTSGDAPAVPVVVTGAGTTFCSGFDLSTRSEGQRFKEHGDRLFEAVLAYPAPVIAAIGGPAVGLGAVLAACCDLRVASAQAWFEIPAARLGVVLDAAYIERVRARFGMAAAQLLFVASRRIDARRALELGAIHALADDPVAEATAWAEHAASLAPASLAAHKAFLNGFQRDPPTEGG